MNERRFSDKELREQRLAHAKDRAYSEICPPMNRAERRTAKGRMLVAQAEAAALRAELDFLRAAAIGSSM